MTLGDERALSAGAGRLLGGKVRGLGISSLSLSISAKKILFPDFWNGLRGSVAGGLLAAISGDSMLLLLLFSLSALSALNKRSSGDCTASRGTVAGCTISGSGDDSCFSGVFSPSKRACKGLAPFGTDFEKNLGIGSEAGAGELWKVGPAYACSFAGVAGSRGPPRDTGLGFWPYALPMLPFGCGVAPLATLCLCGFGGGGFFDRGEGAGLVTESDMVPSSWGTDCGLFLRWRYLTRASCCSRAMERTRSSLPARRPGAGAGTGAGEPVELIVSAISGGVDRGSLRIAVLSDGPSYAS